MAVSVEPHVIVVSFLDLSFASFHQPRRPPMVPLLGVHGPELRSFHSPQVRSRSLAIGGGEELSAWHRLLITVVWSRFAGSIGKAESACRSSVTEAVHQMDPHSSA